MSNNPTESRLGTVGGQAVLEGVMMKSKNDLAIAVRADNGTIRVKRKKLRLAKDRFKPAGWPIIRGVVNFVEMLMLSVTTLTESADMAITEQPSADGKKEGASETFIASAIGIVLGLGLSFVLFFYLPVLSGSLVRKAVENQVLISVTEGVTRLAIFVGYISLTALMKDIRRTYQYHGAEHMSVFTHESGDELTVENVRKYSRFHPRCGTSFMIIMFIIGVIISALIPLQIGDIVIGRALRTAIKLLLLPLIVGIGYEFIRFAGKHDNALVRAVSAPGMWIQRLTTRVPDDSQIEVAIASLKAALPEFYPIEEALTDEITEIQTTTAPDGGEAALSDGTQ